MLSLFSSYLVLISILATTTTAPQSSLAKPLSNNQVKFRRLPPKEFSAALGSSITIECEAASSPPPSIHWLKDGQRISQNDIDENQLDDGQSAIQVDDINRIALGATRSRLVIDCANYNDEATYTCVAENAFTRISSHTKLTLIKPPALVQSANGGVGGGAVDEQDVKAATLAAYPQCLGQRAPEPVRIHMWTHNVVELMKNDVVLFCRSNVKRQQLQQPQQLDLVAAHQPLLEDEQKQQQLDSNDQIKTTTGTRTYVSWTLPDDKLVSADVKDKYEILETGDLLIKDLKWSDMGSYVCTVSDDLGSDSISAFVYPASVKPKNKNNDESNNNSNSNSKRSTFSTTATTTTTTKANPANRLSIFDWFVN